MTTDPFAEAARAEAERRLSYHDKQWGDIMRPMLHMAEWARTYLAAQEPTDAEVLTERIAGKLCDPSRHVAHWPLVGTDPYCGQCYTLAERVLPVVDDEASARAARRDEEKR